MRQTGAELFVGLPMISMNGMLWLFLRWSNALSQAVVPCFLKTAIEEQG
jgi:hypothetical protein